jgi:hypothetical protein
MFAGFYDPNQFIEGKKPMFRKPFLGKIVPLPIQIAVIAGFIHFI